MQGLEGGRAKEMTRKKNLQVLIIDKRQVMSDKKIVRLKTPVKTGQQGRSIEETRLESEQFSQESTILLVKSVACSQELQVALINEINKVYKELSKTRTVAQTYEQENITLKNRIEVVERESRTHKEQYLLQRDNHRRLRRFYQAREQQWISIVNEHRRILQQYHRTPPTGPGEDQYSQLESMYTNLEQMLSSRQGKQVREGRRWTRGQDRDDSLSPKFQLNLQAQRDKDHSRDTSQTRIDFKLSSSSIRPKRQLQGKLTEMTPPKQNDYQKTPPKPTNGILQSILRRTYESYREKGMCSEDIEQLQDMIKLRNAKTSTKQRLAKTIRKLEFPVNNQTQIKNLCECIEKAVIDRYKTLRGDFAFDYIVERFRNYEGITQSDMHQSQIVRYQPSSLRTQRITQLPLQSSIKDEKTKQKIVRKSLESTLQPRGHTPTKRPNDSGEQERMHSSHVFNRVLQPGDDLSRK